MSSCLGWITDVAVRAVTVTGPETVWGYAPYFVLVGILLWTVFYLSRQMDLYGPIPGLFAGGSGPPAFVIEEDDTDE